MRSTLIFVLLFAVSVSAQDRVLLNLDRSVITFVSDAPLEHITATNTAATGLLDPDDRTFAIRIPIASFLGFNSPLQYEHFIENYMLTDQWATATMKGRIIEDVNFSTLGNFEIRAKGELTIKGETKERIIVCKLQNNPDSTRITATFDIPLEDHGIRIPKVVQQKIAPIVVVDVDLFFVNSRK